VLLQVRSAAASAGERAAAPLEWPSPTGAGAALVAGVQAPLLWAYGPVNPAWPPLHTHFGTAHHGPATACTPRRPRREQVQQLAAQLAALRSWRQRAASACTSALEAAEERLAAAGAAACGCVGRVGGAGGALVMKSHGMWEREAGPGGKSAGRRLFSRRPCHKGAGRQLLLGDGAPPAARLPEAELRSSRPCGACPAPHAAQALTPPASPLPSSATSTSRARRRCA
jgi:hypothetical protein